jgi:hypothetical protein
MKHEVFRRFATLTSTGSNIDKARFAIALCFREEFSVLKRTFNCTAELFQQSSNRQQDTVQR